jgi:hypothetical protein
MCPCWKCQDKVVAYNTWKTHAEEMARGERARGVTSADCDYGAMHQEVSASAQRPPTDIGRALALDVVELVSQGAATQRGCDGMLKVVHTRLADLLPADLGVPTSWHTARKRALEGGVLPHVMRDFCPDCDLLFPEDDRIVRCERCNRDTRYSRGSGKCVRQAPYFSLPGLVQRMYAARLLAMALRYGTRLAPLPSNRHTSREMWDAYDATLLPSLIADLDIDRAVTVLFTLSCDGVEVRKESLTPLVAKCLSLPPKVRGLLSHMFLLAAFPRRVRDYNSFLRPAVEQFARHAPGREPIRVEDASAGGAAVDVFVAIVWTVNDIRGVPSTTCGRQPPCFVGPCNTCDIAGIRPRCPEDTWKMKGSVILPGAVRALGNGANISTIVLILVLYRTNISLFSY